MGCYKDSNGKTWNFEITIGLVLYLKKNFGYDLLTPYTNDSTTLSDITQDPYKMLELLIQVVKFCNKDVPEVDVMNSFNNQAFVEAQKAFADEWVNFSLSGGRSDVAAAIRQAQKLIEAGVKAAEKAIDSIDSNAAIERITQNLPADITTLMKQSGESLVG